MEAVRAEEPKIADPTVNIEPDLRFTMKEWVLYWKMRYESNLERIHKAAQFIDALREEAKKVKAENAKLQERCNTMQSQYDAEVKARQAQQAEGRLEPKLKAVEPSIKKFKRKKKKA